MERSKPGLYAVSVKCFSRVMMTTFELQMVPPNSERYPALMPAALHTIEHLGREFFNSSSEWSKKIVYFGPMGSRIGFSLVVEGNLTANTVVFPKARFATVRELVMGMCWSIMSHTANLRIPNATPEECGNYLDHNLLAARTAAHNYYGVLLQSS